MPKLIDKSQFDTVRRDPRLEALLPELVKRLIQKGAGSHAYERLRISDGEGYRDKGLDGQVHLHEPVGPLPAGELRLEIGATADATAFKVKAQAEYRRVQELVGDAAANMTFVIIGRVPWDGLTKTEDGVSVEWRLHIADVLREEGKTPFSDCIVIDQSALIDWVNTDLDTSLWWLNAIGQRGIRTPRAVLSLEERVKLYLLRFQLGIDPNIMTVEQNLDGLANGLEQGSPTNIFGNSAAEASVAASRYLEQNGYLTSSPCVVVTKESGVETLQSVPVCHIVILEGEAADFANHLSQHRVIVARPLLYSMNQPGHVVLKRPSVEAFARHLDVTGATADAETIARAVGRTMTALERNYGTDTAQARSPWQSPDNPDHDLICKLVILGGWNRGKIYVGKDDPRRLRHRDLELIHELCGLGPVGVDRTIERLVKRYGRGEGQDCGAADPLFATGPDVVNLNAPVDAFYRFAMLFTNEHFDILQEALRRVLQYRAENPPDRDAIFNPAEHFGYSSTLTGGIILSFALIGTFGHQPPLDLRPDEQASPRWCEELYHDAIPSMVDHPQFIDSIQQYLPLLAEGLSHPFLRSLEMLLERNVETIRSIFQPRESALGLHKYHFGNALLWAIERISWKAEHLEPSARILMGLHIAAGPMDNGMGNQPIASLRGLLSLEIPQTEASLEMRLRAYDMLAETFGTPVLDLFEDLLDTRGGFQMSQSRPIFSQVEPPTLTYGDYCAARDHVASLAVGLVADSPQHCRSLIDCVPAMIDSIFERFLDVIRTVEPNTPDAMELADTLRRFTGRHGEFPDADWSMPESRLEPMREMQAHLVNDPKLELRWLFANEYVQLHDVDFRDSQEHLNELRVDAVPVLSENGVNDLLEFAGSVGAPSTVGVAAGQTIADETALALLIEESGDIIDEDARTAFLRGLSRGRGLESPSSWLDSLSTMTGTHSRSVLEALGEGLPSTQPVIEAVANRTDLPLHAVSGFWSWMNIHALHHFEASDATLDALFAHGRAHDLAAIARSEKANLSDDVIAKIFDEFLVHMAAASSEGRRSDMSLYHYWNLAEIVEDRQIHSLEHIAQYQFPLARTLRFNGPKRPAALHRLLAKAPKKFMEVVKLAYRSDAQVQKTDNAVTTTEATVEPHVSEAAWHALDSMTLLPGWQDGGLDSKRMQIWIDDALELADSNGRRIATEVAIGDLLGKSPVDPVDQHWPHRAVRDAIEQGLSSRVLQHIQTGEANSRGIYSGPSRVHHLKMAERFESYAAHMKPWPRTRDMLLAIAKSERRWMDRAASEEHDQAASHGIR